jgi:hypothetical protein
MLTSASVNPNILPGLIKAIEKYIIVYNTDDLIKQLNSALSDIIRTGAKGLMYGASIAAVAAATKAAPGVAKEVGKALAIHPVLRVKGGKFELKEQDLPIIEQASMIKVKTGAAPESIKAIEKSVKDQLKTIEKKSGVTGFEMPRYDALSLEPHWVRVDTPQGAKFLGVKVVPFKVTSTTGMVGLLMKDKELKKMSYLSNKLGRTIMRVFFRAMRGVKIPGIKDKPITGSPKTDIVWAASQYGKNTFVCLSQLDLEQDEAFTSPPVVQRLHKLGWASLIVTDDVNKQATFCMRQFGGICSTIPYAFIFSSLGKEHGQVYRDIEDAQRSAGPFFRKRSTTKRKLFSDAKTIAKLNKYSTLKE